MTDTVIVRPFATIAGTLAASAVAFRTSAEAMDTASTPFAKSVLAAHLNGTSLDMIEQTVLAALGSPKGGAKGKALTLSGIARPENNVKGGAAIYQAWKAIVGIAANLEADAYVVAPGTDEANPDGISGANAIRPAVVAFVLGDDGAAETLRGRDGIESKVRGYMADHAKAIAALVAPAPASNENDAAEGEADTAPSGRQSLTDRANAMTLALNEATPDEIRAAYDALAAMLDHADALVNSLVEADTAPVAAAA